MTSGPQPSPRDFLPSPPEGSACWRVRTYLFWLVLACLLPGILGAAILVNQEYQGDRVQLKEDTLQTARALSHAVDNYVLRAQAMAQGLASSSALVQGDLAAFHRQARQILKQSNLGSAVMLTNRDGQVLLHTSKEFGERLPLHGNPEMVRRVFETGEPAISDLYRGTVMGRFLVSVGVPVLVNGRVTYVLNVPIWSEHFNDMLKFQDQPSGRYVSLADGTGTIIARTRDADKYVGRKVIPEYLQRIINSDEGAMETRSIDGTPVFAVYSRSLVTNWTISIATPLEAIEGHRRQTTAFLSLGVLLLFAVSLSLAWFLGERIARSFRVLRAPAVALGAGKPVSLPVVAVKEAAELNQALGEAAQLLEERTASLLARESELAARTAALQRSQFQVHALTEHSPGSIAVFDEQMRYLAVSRRFLDAWRMRAEDVIGRCHYDVFPQVLETWKDAHRRGLAGEVVRAESEPFQWPDGSVKWIRWEVWPWYDDTGAVGGIIVADEDITERKEAEEQLRASEEKYRTLFNTMNEGLAIGEPVFDQDGRPVDLRLIEVNDAFYRQTGLPRGIEGRNMREYLPHLEQFWVERNAAVARTGVPDSFDHPDVDTGRHYQTYAFSPAPGKFANLFLDISEEKRMQQALEESEGNLRQLIDTLPGMVWTATPQGSIDFLSRHWYEYTGMAEEIEPSQGVFDCIYPTDRQEVIQSWRAALAHRAAAHLQFRLRQRDGQFRWFNARVNPGMDREGNITRWLGVLTDIHDLKVTYEALNASRAELLEAQRLARIGTWVWDARTDITVSSPELLRIYGRDRMPPFGEQLGTIYSPEVWHEIKAAIEHCVATGTSYHLEVPASRGDGSPLWVAVRGERLPMAEGGSVKVRGTVQDITERRLAEQEIERLNADLARRVEERTAELTAANRELESFTFATSHDLKGPLGRINTFSALLEQRYRDVLVGEGLQFLDYIRQNAIRLNKLVDDLLHHARAAQHPLELQPVNLAALVASVLQDQEESIREAGATVRVDLPPVAVLADASFLGQVFQNLVQNALKYSRSDQMPVIEIGGNKIDGSFRVSVRDNGIGFDMAYHDRIFEMFRRLHTYNDYEGSGVGLALVKRAMERMGGRVWAESAPGQGSVFYLELSLPT